MIRTLLFPLALASSATFAQLAPGRNAALIDHMREVNAEWRTRTDAVADASPVRFNNDTERIAQHLHLVRSYLAGHTPEGLSAEQADQRGELLNALELYADAGRFPQNHVLPYRNPVFIDPHNTACAVGQLMIESGHRELAERIDAEMELAYIREIKMKEVDEWAVEHGFTQDELAWIQPGYPPSIPWYPLGNGTNGEVSELLLLSDGDMLVAGQFTEAGEQERFHVARWNGTAYEEMGSLPEGVVNAAIEFDGHIMIGGSFNNGTADLLTWNGTSWAPSTALPGKSSAITAFHTYLGTLYAAGSRDGFAGTDHLVARRIGGDWQMVGQDLNGAIRAFATLGDDLYIGGDFTGAFLSTENDILHIARMGDASWGQVGDGLNGSVHALLVYDDKLYATGDMISEISSYFGLARIAHNAPTWEQLMPNINNYIYSPLDGPMRGNALVEKNGEIYIGGDFYVGTLMVTGSGLAVFHGDPDAVEAYANFMGPVQDLELLGTNQLVMAGFSNGYQNIASTELTTGINDKPAKLTFSTMPNPVVDVLTVQLPATLAANAPLRVTDITGRVMEVPTERNGLQVRLNARSLAAGQYQIEVSDGASIATGKFVKQ
jgi:hypothetical protein